jgi:tetratricopeptide (TPR) repeat protein
MKQKHHLVRRSIFTLVLMSNLLCAALYAQDPSQDGAASQLLSDAQSSLHRGDWATAASLLERVVENDPRNKSARAALVSTLMRINRIADAEKQAASFALQFPDETEPVFLTALLAFQQGQMQRVSELTADCLKRGDQRAEVYKLSAISSYLTGRPELFETQIRAAIRQNPRDADSRYHLGRFLFEQKRYGDALESFNTAAALAPDHYKARYYKGLLFTAENKLEEAKQEYLASIQIVDRVKTRYAWPFADLGAQLVNEGEYERGVGWLYRAVRNDPTSPYAHYGYAKALFQKGPNDEVKHELLEALRLDPGYSEAYYLLARYYQKAGEAELAKETLSKFEKAKKNPTPSPFGLRRW